MHSAEVVSVMVSTALAALLSTTLATCTWEGTCFCGLTNATLTFCLDRVPEGSDPCSTWSNCQTCRRDLGECLTCPSGKFGSTCLNNETARHKRRRKRQYNRFNRRCPEIKGPKSGSLDCWTSGSFRQCTGTCLPGYVFQAQKHTKEIVLSCSGGSWYPTDSYPRCISEGHCDLDMKGAGAYNCTTSMKGTYCDVICYGISSSYQRYFCYPGNGWDPPLPSCVREKLDGRYEPDHSSVSTCRCANGGSCDEDDECVCMRGYTGRFCDRVEPPSVTCSDPGFATNGGRLTYNQLESTADSFAENSSLIFSCNAGYLLRGASVITCTASGRWSAPRPSCQLQATTRRPVTCGDPGQVASAERLSFTGAAVSSRSATRFQAGDSIIYVCDSGYTRTGSSHLTCLSSGQWSARRPTCRRAVLSTSSTTTTTTTTTTTAPTVTCTEPGIDPNGDRTVDVPQDAVLGRNFVQGTWLDYTCREGYTLQGDEAITCLGTGRWSAPRPTCQSAPRSPLDGRFPEDEEEEEEEEDRLTYCDSPDLLNNGQWTVASSQYEDKLPQRGQDQIFPETTMLSFTCNSGYALEGPNYIQCQQSGVWSEDIPSCVIEEVEEEDRLTYCESPGPISNGQWTVSSSQHEDKLPQRGQEQLFPETTRMSFTCEEGYALVGRNNIHCQQSGDWSEDIPYCVVDCGRSKFQTSHRIHHGIKTEPGEWPWTVAIANITDGYSRLTCGGALLDSRTVLTAAHCLMHSEDTVPERTSNIRLYFGKFHRSDVKDDNKVIIGTPSTFIVYSGFDPTTMDNDIALIRFAPPIKFSERIQPVCLPSAETSAENLFPPSMGYVLGWGTTEKNLLAEELLMAYIPVVPGPECRAAYRNQNLRMPITSNMFCAGFPEGRSGSCTGDSGGPLVFYNKSSDRHTVEGVVSFGSRGECGLPQRYTVFTQVSKYINWIRMSMRS